MAAVIAVAFLKDKTLAEAMEEVPLPLHLLTLIFLGKTVTLLGIALSLQSNTKISQKEIVSHTTRYCLCPHIRYCCQAKRARPAICPIGDLPLLLERAQKILPRIKLS